MEVTNYVCTEEDIMVKIPLNVFKSLQQIKDTALDYQCGIRLPGFAEEYGGLDPLRDDMFRALDKHEAFFNTLPETSND